MLNAAVPVNFTYTNSLASVEINSLMLSLKCQCHQLDNVIIKTFRYCFVPDKFSSPPSVFSMMITIVMITGTDDDDDGVQLSQN